MKEFIEKLRIEFFSELDKKPTWGRQQIKELFMMSIYNSMLNKKDPEDK